MPLTQVFVSIFDPRNTRQVRHYLSELLTVTVCAVLCSADEFSEIEAWAKERIGWLRGFLVLEHGISSHDTFGRLFAALKPCEFEATFWRWVGHLVPALGPDAGVAIDGKSSRRSTTKAAANPLHLVSAFAADIGLVLGQTATTEKSDEFTAIPELLATPALNGCIVTIDAMGTQVGIMQIIREGGANYVLCVKDSHPKLVESFIHAQTGMGGALTPDSTTESREDGHGRTEVRRGWAFDAVEQRYKLQSPDPIVHGDQHAGKTIAALLHDHPTHRLQEFPLVGSAQQGTITRAQGTKGTPDIRRLTLARGRRSLIRFGWQRAPRGLVMGTSSTHIFRHSARLAIKHKFRFLRRCACPECWRWPTNSIRRSRHPQSTCRSRAPAHQS